MESCLQGGWGERDQYDLGDALEKYVHIEAQLATLDTWMSLAREIPAKLNVSTGKVCLLLSFLALLFHSCLVACKIHETVQFLIK